MSGEWKRNRAAGKGLTVELSGLAGSVPRSFILSFDSHGDLDKVELAAVPIEVVIGCKIECNGGCVPFVDLAVIKFPPGTKVWPEIPNTESCCP